MEPNSNGRSKWGRKPQTLLRGPMSNLILPGVQMKLSLNAHQAAPTPSVQSERDRNAASRDMCVPEVIGVCNLFSKLPKASPRSLQNAVFYRTKSRIDLE